MVAVGKYWLQMEQLGTMVVHGRHDEVLVSKYKLSALLQVVADAQIPDAGMSAVSVQVSQ
jgi:hypothetical protein